MSTQRRHSSKSPFYELFLDWRIENVTQHHATKRLARITVNPKEGGALLLKATAMDPLLVNV